MAGSSIVPDFPDTGQPPPSKEVGEEISNRQTVFLLVAQLVAWPLLIKAADYFDLPMPWHPEETEIRAVGDPPPPIEEEIAAHAGLTPAFKEVSPPPITRNTLVEAGICPAFPLFGAESDYPAECHAPPAPAPEQ